MPHTVRAAIQQELRQAGLPGQGLPGRLLGLLRDAPTTHLGLAEILRMATEAGLTIAPAEIARQLETLAALGLLGRLPSTAVEPIFDTVPRPHSHLIYEETAETVDLDVSPETLLAILRQALAERPDQVDVLIRFRRDPPPARSSRSRRTAPGPACARNA
ncbi:transcriptional repressor [Dankookia sp. P2]|uniref:transcriptional repressor n=1 Tax=Dankookia sp. P2 TaxID=3423955 RepID=UPI003D665E25